MQYGIEASRKRDLNLNFEIVLHSLGIGFTSGIYTLCKYVVFLKVS